MTPIDARMDPLRVMLLGIGVLAAAALGGGPLAAQTGKVFVVQTNSAGDSVMLVDPATDTIVAEIPDAEVVHGAAVAPDGSRFYLSNESTETLDIVDVKTLRIVKKIPLTGRPNNVAIRRDGRRVYVAIQMAQGGVDVIDTVAQEKTKFIRVLGGVHNTFITPDSRYVVAGSTGGSVATVIDTQTEQPVWSIHFEGGVRPLCFETNADGSTRRMFVQITNLHGFAIVDWAARREVGRITLPELPPGQRNSEGIQGAPAHGILIAPDGRTLWSTSKFNSAVYAYSVPDLTYLGEVKVGKVPDWLTFTTDSRKLYVANAHDNTVSIVDVAARREITTIRVGQVPKRNITAVLPAVPYAWPAPSPAARPASPAQPAVPRAAAAGSAATLDYETFRTTVQPILMSSRKGNARCTACHASGGGNAYLEPLAPGATAYTDEQTRRNFERVRRLVVPGEPLESVLLVNPLAEEAGGSHWHGGGKHWQSQNDPEWRTLAAWVAAN